MNNIRKIIEERLDNADLESDKFDYDNQAVNFMFARGQVKAYQDCLNLIDEYTPKIVTKQLSVKEIETLLQDLNKPHQFIIDKPAPRTEAELLKEFEKLGWKVHRNTKVYLKLEDKYYRQICVNKNDKTYAHTVFIGMQEHKLLNELFTLWGWL